METLRLNVEPRQGTGKERAGRMRRGGKVPGVFYGPGQSAASLCVEAREFHFKLENAEGSHLIQFSSPAPELHEKMALLKEVQRHPVTSAPLHLDFYEVDVTKPLQVTVPLHFTGKAEGVTAGGILQSMAREITVECLPRDIPEFLQVDVSALKMHESIRIGEILLPAGVKAIYDTDTAVVSVVAAQVVVETKPAEAAAEAVTATAEAAPVGGAAPAGGEKK